MSKINPLFEVMPKLPVRLEEEVETGGGWLYTICSGSHQYIIGNLRNTIPFIHMWFSHDTCASFTNLPVVQKHYNLIKVKVLTFRDAHILLTDMMHDKVKLVAVDAKLDLSATYVPIEVFIDLIWEAISEVNPYRAECDAYVRLIRASRQLGFSLDVSTISIPVQCEKCFQTFLAAESLYVAWRNGLGELRCNCCNQLVEIGLFDKTLCAKCGAYSGRFPASLCELFKNPTSRWICQDCTDQNEYQRISKLISKG
jgi:hypothetical protein